jgi:hypothetical protein
MVAGAQTHAAAAAAASSQTQTHAAVTNAGAQTPPVPAKARSQKPPKGTKAKGAQGKKRATTTKGRKRMKEAVVVDLDEPIAKRLSPARPTMTTRQKSADTKEKSE